MSLIYSCLVVLWCHVVVPLSVPCFVYFVRYDFGITAWSVLMIKARGLEGVSDLYYYLATHGEALGMLVAAAPVGGFIEGLLGSKVGGCNWRYSCKEQLTKKMDRNTQRENGNGTVTEPPTALHVNSKQRATAAS